VVLDVDATESIDSKGLASLLNVQDKLRDAGGEAKIATTNPNNRKILEITRLDQQLEVFDSVVDAVKAFQ
jgi:anti-sigma B factor antagonist